MDKKIIEEFLVNECGMKGPKIDLFMAKITKYEDIGTEFCRWIQTGDFSSSLLVEGYSAKDIHEKAPFMRGIGVYNFLVDLRDKPEQAKKIIREGFAVM